MPKLKYLETKLLFPNIYIHDRNHRNFFYSIIFKKSRNVQTVSCALTSMNCTTLLFHSAKQYTYVLYCTIVTLDVLSLSKESLFFECHLRGKCKESAVLKNEKHYHVFMKFITVYVAYFSSKNFFIIYVNVKYLCTKQCKPCFIYKNRSTVFI